MPLDTRVTYRVVLLGASAEHVAWITDLLASATTARFEVVEVADVEADLGSLRIEGDVALHVDVTNPNDPVICAALPRLGLPLVVITDRNQEACIVTMLAGGVRACLVREETETRSLVTALVGAMERPRTHDLAVASTFKGAGRDAATGLANRDLLMDRLGQALASARRTGQKLALMVVSVDHLKLVNDTLGSQVGTALLRGIGRALGQSLRETDTAARVGAQEFALLITNLREELDAARIAMNVIDALQRPLDAEGHSISCAANVGIATAPLNGDVPEILFRRADAAMVQSLRAGPGRLEFYTEEMNSRVIERLALEGGLRTAAEDGSLVLHYQPIFDLRRGRMVGAEALIRWNHPELGFLSPDRFLSLAENSGHIQPIGEWVLAQACAQAVAWQRRGHSGFRIAVNVSPIQLQNPDFIEVVHQALIRSELAPHSLEIEITETTLVEDTEVTVEALHELKRLGVHLSVDDFGTGYSALAYLKDLPIDVLKIDRSFVQSLMTDPAGATIVEAIVRMAQGLNLTTVAEGVEEHDQLLMLGSLGCQRMQGYLCGRPVPAAGFERWISDPGMRWATTSEDTRRT